MNPPLCRRAQAGFKADVTFPIGEGEFLFEAGGMPLPSVPS